MTVFFLTSQAFLSIAVVLSQSNVARTWECNKAPYEVAYGIEICSHLQVGHVAKETAALLVPVVHLSRAQEWQVLHIIFSLASITVPLVTVSH